MNVTYEPEGLKVLFNIQEEELKDRIYFCNTGKIRPPIYIPINLAMIEASTKFYSAQKNSITF